MRIGEYPPRTGLVTANVPATAVRLPMTVAANLMELTPGLRAEMAILAELGLGKPTLERAAQNAVANGTSIEQELIANGWVDESAYYGAIARALRLPYLDHIENGTVVDDFKLDSQLLNPTALRLTHSRRAPLTAIAPQARQIDSIRKSIARYPDLQRSLVVVAPRLIRAAVWRAGAARRVRDTVSMLFDTEPRFSARVVFYGNQGFYVGVTIGVLIAGLMISEASQLLLHALLSMLYLTALLLRALAVFQRRRKRQPPIPHCDTPLPIYTIMVALYHEASVASQLVATLKRIDWPASLLDIKLVCEADDQETILALKAQGLGPQFEIVEVPPM